MGMYCNEFIVGMEVEKGIGDCDKVAFFFSSRRRHTRSLCDWNSDVCSSDLNKIDIFIQ